MYSAQLQKIVSLQGEWVLYMQFIWTEEYQL